MRLAVKIKLIPTEEERDALLRTLHLCNQLANQVSSTAYKTKIYNKVKLQKLTYNTLKAQGLAAQASIHTIRKVADAYATQDGLMKNGVLVGKSKKKATSKPIQFRVGAAQAFDDRNLSFYLDKKKVSIWTVDGRLKSVRFICSEKQIEQLTRYRKGESNLLEEGGFLYLVVGIEVPENPLQKAEDFLAFDSGIVNIATTSDGDNWSGGAVTACRKKNRRLRAKLQTTGTKSAKRLLKKRSKKESRFVTDTNHVISKKIVEMAERTGRGIAFENLKGIRERARVKQSQSHRTQFVGVCSTVCFRYLQSEVERDTGENR